MERHRDEQVIKKGPWTAEEDEVLMNFVNKYGPKDWSSIRSMGLLPRTGKSCRLRWVNKLRPNLKIGCKFSAEEERVVIDLQARFGNKWATIASYLPGRTDNDVKNFWSTRQKRLARILQSPSLPLTSNLEKIKGKSPALVHEMPTPKAPEFNTPQMKEEASSSSKCQSCLSSSNGNSEILQIMSLPNFMMTPNSINLDSTTMPLLDTIETDHHNKSSTQTSLQHSFTHLPFLPESHDSVLGLCESNFLDVFASTRQAVELENVSQINFGSPFLELDGTGRNDGRADSFFDELPADMFDYL